jgi:hypothetical protein
LVPGAAILRSTSGTLVACLLLAACATSAPSNSSSAAAAIRAVLEEDTRLGGVRNHAPEAMPLAEAVGAYVRGLDAIDFGECPADFTAAFERHRDAWQESIRYFEEYPEMRGELHDLFDRIRGVSTDARMRIESIEQNLRGTWAEVEATVD